LNNDIRFFTSAKAISLLELLHKHIRRANNSKNGKGKVMFGVIELPAVKTRGLEMNVDEGS